MAKRIKHVFSNIDDLCHRWAHQTQDDGNTPNHRLYFEGNTLYSYGRHYVVGVVTEVKRLKTIDYPPAVVSTKKLITEKIALLNSEHFSVVTSRHQSAAKSATRGMTQFFVPFGFSHKDNIKWFRKRIADSYDTAMAKGSRHAMRAPRLKRMLEIQAEAQKYADTFKLRIKISVPKDTDALIAKWELFAEEYERTKGAREVVDEVVNTEL